MNSKTVQPLPVERLRSTKCFTWVVGLLLWTGVSMGAGILMYKAELHVKVKRLLDHRNQQLEALHSRDTILKFDRHLLETIQPEHRFQAQTRAEWQSWQSDLTSRLEQVLKLQQMPTDFVPTV